MEPYGYALKGNSKTAASDFIPSLIGVEPQQINGTKADPYFVRVDLTPHVIRSVARSRWTTYDNLPNGDRDPILEVRAAGLGYYIPASALFELAAFNHDDDTIAMIVAIGAQPK